jgi:class 3 adenylate cyclase
MPRTTELAICFVDVCDSTPLFVEHGDDRARELVGRALRLLEDTIEEHGGTVVKSLGDGIMGTFPRLPPATRAAMQFPEVVKQDETLVALDIEVRGGLYQGSVVQEDDGDVFGDAVNTASRLAEWAHANQVVTTRHTLDALPNHFRDWARDLGPTTLRGKSEPVEIVELLGKESGSSLTVVEDEGVDSGREADTVLVLEYDGDSVVVDQDPLWIGRGDSSDLRIEDRRVSRIHAVVEKRRGSFRIVDQSTNGTYVRVGNEDTIFLHHESLDIHGSGRISLGRSLDAEDARLLRFTCEMSSSEEQRSP